MFRWTACASLRATRHTPAISLPFTSNGRRTYGFVPNTETCQRILSHRHCSVKTGSERRSHRRDGGVVMWYTERGNIFSFFQLSVSAISIIKHLGIEKRVERITATYFQHFKVLFWFQLPYINQNFTNGQRSFKPPPIISHNFVLCPFFSLLRTELGILLT
jgi:hypothetical protein